MLRYVLNEMLADKLETLSLQTQESKSQDEVHYPWEQHEAVRKGSAQLGQVVAVVVVTVAVVVAVVVVTVAVVAVVAVVAAVAAVF